MRDRQAAMLKAYAWPVAWVVAGFVAAEILQGIAGATGTRWPATLAVWLSLLALIAGTACALWLSWRIWRNRPLALAARDEE